MCSRIWRKTLEMEIFQRIADNQFLQAEHVTRVMGVVRPWLRFPSESVAAPPLEVFRTGLGGTLTNLV